MFIRRANKLSSESLRLAQFSFGFSSNGNSANQDAQIQIPAKKELGLIPEINTENILGVDPEKIKDYKAKKDHFRHSETVLASLNGILERKHKEHFVFLVFLVSLFHFKN